MSWVTVNNKLVKRFLFKDFKEAWGFMCKVALAAEQANHHPEWTNHYNKVEIKLTTHDAGNCITDKDRRLAEIIDSFE